jgi:hypothetical protein
MGVDDDIEFDFFEDEPATTEAPAPRVRLPLRPGGPGRARRRYGPPRGAAPLVRLLLLVGFVVFLVLVFALLIQSCASASKHDSYSHYMDNVSKIATQSSSNGKSLLNVLTTPGLSVAQIETRLRGIADQERQNVTAAANLNAPGQLRDENQHLIEALELRVSGVDGLATTFQKTSKSTNTTEDAVILADQAERLIASDVVWDDLFKALAVQQLQRDGVTGVAVPDSHFVANADLLAAPSHFMALILQRIRGAATGGGTVSGLHGTNIGTVTAEPGGQVLSASTLTTVTATTTLAFQVTVDNGGDSQEVQIPVTLTIDRPQAQGGPITKTQTIDVINPGETKTLTFDNLGQVPFASQTSVKVDVATVPGETNKTNNSTTYPVIFSLP